MARVRGTGPGRRRWRPGRGVLGAALAAAMFSGPAAAETWTVAMTPKQAGGYAEQAARAGHKAFAFSPDGAWGYSFGMDAQDAAKDRAMAFCRGFLKPGRRDCILYSVNGKIVAPSQIETRRVSAVYRPIDGKAAGRFFGRAPVDFRGNRSAAIARMKAVSRTPATVGALVPDRVLMRALSGRTLTGTRSGGYAIWLGPEGAEHHSQAKSGILQTRFRRWVATAEGVICLIDGRWYPSGAPVAQKCLVLSDVAAGQGTMSWDGSPDTARDVQVIAGDARFGAAR